ncbi:hypothetical protein FNF28_07706 [Cafeteria roenbergensis]|uniref:Uncharacterized protein n=1 Tax=Cafeteria roenbergensis TaxID=33653 RepID=A0A5A8C0Y4_CAFRO|nr:hypothetical protein FNF28_07706 [Cafeteria roenbergensis]
MASYKPQGNLRGDSLRALVGRPLVPFFDEQSNVNESLQEDKQSGSAGLAVPVREFTKEGYFEPAQLVRSSAEVEPKPERTRSRASPIPSSPTDPSAAAATAALCALFKIGQ